MHAPVDLRDGIESLEYWRGRRKRLAWYRVRARREAREMVVRWEQRVRAAALQQQGVPLGERFAAGLLVGKARLERLPIRRVAIGLGLFAAAVIAIPVILTIILVVQIF